MKYILSAVMMFVMSGIAVAGEAPATPYPLCPAHYDAVKAVLEGRGMPRNPLQRWTRTSPRH